MKRIVIFGLLLTLFLACFSMPEKAFAVNKGDSAVEQQLNTMPDPDSASIGARQTFPDRWDEDPIAENEHLVVRAAADVHTKPDGIYPMYRTRFMVITKDMVINMAIKCLDKPTVSAEDMMTKDGWGQALQQFLDARARYDEWVKAGKPNDWTNVDAYEWTPEQIEEQTNWYMEQIKNAPEVLSEKTAKKHSDLKPQLSFELASGEIASVYYGYQYFIIAKGCKNDPHVYDAYQYSEDLRWKEGEYKLWQGSNLTREQAEAVCLSEAEKLGFEDFVIAGACEATLFDHDMKKSSNRSVTGGWYLTLRRSFDGYPQFTNYVYASQGLLYGSDDTFAFKAFTPHERLRMFISENGLQMIDYEYPKDVSGLVNANVELMPFDEVKQRIANTLLMCFPYEDAGKVTVERNENSPRLELEIYDIMLTTFALHVKNSAKDFYEIPCWVVYYACCDPVRGADDWELKKSSLKLELCDPNAAIDVLIINAVDGSVLYGYDGY